VPRPRFEPSDRAILTALARVLGRDRWSIFLVNPDTLCATGRAIGPTARGLAGASTRRDRLTERARTI
jgi:GAF domain-containing protein